MLHRTRIFSVEWLKLRSALTTILVPQPLTSNPQPINPTVILRLLIFLQPNPKVDIFPYNKTELSARLLTMIPTLQKARKYATFSLYLSFLDSKQTASTVFSSGIRILVPLHSP